MADKKYIYRPLASYQKLKEAEDAIKKAQTLEDLRTVIAVHGPRVGYKAFSYIFMGKMTPEAMKPDEAADAAIKLANEGASREAHAIVAKICEWHPNHQALRHSLETIRHSGDALPSWILEQLDYFE